jgi:hypothetical protein
MRKHTIDYITNYFEERGCELLSNDYANNRQILDYKCVCGNLSKIRFSDFKEGKRCNKCGIIKTKEKKKLDAKYVINYFASRNCILLDDYQGNQYPMLYICNCGRLSKIAFDNFVKGKRCRECGKLKISDSNNYQWREDRDKLKKESLFRKKCYNILYRTLKMTNKHKKGSCYQILGYSANELINHIEQNYPTFINTNFHLDHIFPIKAFMDFGILDIKLINCLENIQPLNCNDNWSKGDKYNKNEFLTWLNKKGVILSPLSFSA